MLRKNSIIYLLMFIFLLQCAPSKYYIEKNNTYKKYTNNSGQKKYYNNGNFYDSTDMEYNSTDDYRINKDYISDASYFKHNDIKNSRNYNIKKTNSDIKIYNSFNENGKKILKDKIYRVKKGDNLYKISDKLDIPVSSFIKFNNISNRNKIYPGMILKIPVKNPATENKNKSYSEITSDILKIRKKSNFNWPSVNIYSARRDGADGVKSIGIIIISAQSSPVLSSAAGIVTKVGYMRGFGNYIILKHSNNYLTIYSYLKEIKVNEGDNISGGKVIAYLEENKLHFQICHSGKPEDPLTYLSKKS